LIHDKLQHEAETAGLNKDKEDLKKAARFDGSLLEFITRFCIWARPLDWAYINYICKIAAIISQFTSKLSLLIHA